jgi:pSer/pThr/pTyr-binding forkhead associated (FHA) protein
MPWITISANGDELDRRELDGPLTIGRSPESDVVVRDILLSRTHCRLEPVGNGWKVADLKSKNGTRVGWQNVDTHVLRDGDHLRMGRTRIVYHTGPFEPAPPKSVKTNRMVRPADPHEALTGTVTDFVLLDDHEDHPQSDPEFFRNDRPFPQPRPTSPDGATTGQSSPLDDAASSFWCREGDGESSAKKAVAAGSSRAVVRALPRYPVKPIYREIRRPTDVQTDLSLQVDASQVAVTPTPFTPQAPLKKKNPWKRLLALLALATAAILGTSIMMMSLWLLTLAP